MFFFTSYEVNVNFVKGMSDVRWTTVNKKAPLPFPQ